MSDFSHDWLEISALLCGSRSTGEIAAKSITDLSHETNLADIFHDVAVCKLTDSQWQTRENSALAIKLLCQKHSAAILQEFMMTTSDGELLLLSDIHVENVMRDGVILRGYEKADTGDEEKRVGSMYDPKWIQYQRKQLRKRLGIETRSSDATLATKYTDVYHDLIAPDDIVLGGVAQDSVTKEPERVTDQERRRDSRSNEAWIVRILRKLVAGMLDATWEVRHGSSLGVMAIVQGLHSAGTSDHAPPPASASVCPSYEISDAIPSFIIEDISATSLCVLILDRFLDFRDSTKSFSPVKEAAGRLLAVVMSRQDRQTSQGVIQKVLEVSRYDPNDWCLSQGGLLALKYIIPLQPETLLSGFDCLADAVLGSLDSNNDEIYVPGALLLRSMDLAAFAEPEPLRQRLQADAAFCSRWQAVLTLCVQKLSSIIEQNPSPLESLDTVALALRSCSSLLFFVPLDISVFDAAVAEVFASFHLVLRDAVRSEARCSILGAVRDVLQTVAHGLSAHRACQGSTSRAGAWPHTHLQGSRIASLTCSVSVPSSLTLPPTHARHPISAIVSLMCCLVDSTARGLPVADVEPVGTDSSTSNALRLQEWTSFSDYAQRLAELCSEGFKPLLAALVDDDAHNSSSDETSAVDLLEKVMGGFLWSTVAFLLPGSSLPRKPTFTQESGQDESVDVWGDYVLGVYTTLRQKQLTCWASPKDEAFILLFEAVKMMSSMPALSTSTSRKRKLGIEDKGTAHPGFIPQLLGMLLDRTRCVVSDLNDFKPVKATKKPFTLVFSSAKPSGTAPGKQSNVSDTTWASMLPTLEGLLTISIAVVEPLYTCLHEQTINASQTCKFVNHMLSIEDVKRFNDGVVAASKALVVKPKAASRVGKLTLLTRSLDSIAAGLSQVLIQTLDTCEHVSSVAFMAFDRLHRQLAGLKSESSISLLRFAATSAQEGNMVSKVFLSRLASSFTEYEDLQETLPLEVLISFDIRTLLAVLMPLADRLPRSCLAVLVERQVPSVLISAVSALAVSDDAEASGRVITMAASVLAAMLTCTPVTSLTNAALDQILLAARGACYSAATHARRITYKILRALVERTADHVLLGYRDVLAIAMKVHDPCLVPLTQAACVNVVHGLYKGFSDSDRDVRSSAAAMFRRLVMYAPLARIAAVDGQNVRSANILADSRDPAGVNSLSDYLITRSPFPRLFPTGNLSDATPSSAYTHASMMPQVCAAATFLDGRDRGGLRDYQWNGVFWITQLRSSGLGAALCDEMGTGKTAQAIAALLIHRLEVAPTMRRAMLVVCPGSVVPHWAAEIRKFIKDSTILSPMFYSPQLLADLRRKDPGNAVVLVSYSTLTKDQHILRDFIWDAIVLDEAHLVRNPAKADALAVFSLKSDFRIALTGTPIQHQVEDVWSIVNFIIPGFLGEFAAFEEQFVKPIRLSMNYRKRRADDPSEFSSQQSMQEYFEISAIGLEKLKLLHTQILPFLLRRLKADVLAELPPKTVVDVFCPLTQRQRQMYDHFQQGLGITDASLEEDLKSSREVCTVPKIAGAQEPAIKPVAALTYLKLLCLHPALVVSSVHVAFKARLMGEDGSSGKAVALARLLEEAGVVSHDERASCRPSGTSEPLGEELLDDYLDSETLGDFNNYPDDKDDRDDDDDDSDGGSSGSVHDDDNDRKYKKIDPFVHPDEEQEQEEEEEEEGDDGGGDDDDGNTGRGKHPPGGTEIYKNTVQTCAVSAEPCTRQIKFDSSYTQEGHVPESKKKCLIYAQHRSALDIVEQCALQRFFPGVSYERLDGSVPPLTRAKRVERFNASISSDPSATRILLMTTGACGLGLNLSAADTVIFVEPDWNPFVDLQAMDRVHRIGQTNPVTVYRLVAGDTVESCVAGVQGLKEQVFNEVINSTNDGGGLFAAGEVSSNAGSGSCREGFRTSLWTSLALSCDSCAGAAETSPELQNASEDEYECLDIEKFLKQIGRQ